MPVIDTLLNTILPPKKSTFFVVYEAALASGGILRGSVTVTSHFSRGKRVENVYRSVIGLPFGSVSAGKSPERVRACSD